MLIDGVAIESKAGKVAVIKNPANQEPVATVSLGGERMRPWPSEPQRGLFPDGPKPIPRRGEPSFIGPLAWSGRGPRR